MGMVASRGVKLNLDVRHFSKYGHQKIRKSTPVHNRHADPGEEQTLIDRAGAGLTICRTVGEKFRLRYDPRVSGIVESHSSFDLGLIPTFPEPKAD
jgi:hypothetical protein